MDRFEHCLEVVEVVAHVYWHLTLVSEVGGRTSLTGVELTKAPGAQDISPSATSAMVDFLTATLHTLRKCEVEADLRSRLVCTVIGALRQLATHDHLLMVLRSCKLHNLPEHTVTTLTLLPCSGAQRTA